MPFSCDSCEQVFKYENHFKVHTQNSHGPQIWRKCVSCNKAYKQINNFVVHFKKKHFQKCHNKKCNLKEMCRTCASRLQEVKNKWLTKAVHVIKKKEEVCSEE